ncbi:MAG: tetratricopeptide repeat protein [Pirellulales bacterium]|jgi:tetratricopeptide (TPR) repeat protein|nr:tetratricopeptide repeat protein [Thermoguttaceae bacterium]MDD4786116.1 tetratricopeptide repeat protein [Pirellulales bacterium]MDI9442831.1 tetratricopeptide repeat protein [Planctomycetota bacterium]NLY99574.1 tetratricopeptide repeat protein [Pirellulaceae bacterium]
MHPPSPTILAWLLGLGFMLSSQPGCQLWGREAPISPATIVSRQLCRQGVAAMERACWQEAEPLLSKAVDVCPEDPDARHKFGRLLWARGSRAEAVAQLAEAIRLSPEDPSLRVAYGEMQMALGNLQSARESAESALDLKLDLAAAWALRGRIMHQAGHLRESLSDLHRAQCLASGDAEIEAEIANIYLEIGQPDRALATVQSLARRWAPPDEPAAILAIKGRSYLALGRHEDAVAQLSAAAQQGDRSLETLYCLAKAEMLAGRPQHAAQAAFDALAVDPAHGPSRHLLAQMGIDSAIVRR